jgi:hypothetical protein
MQFESRIKRNLILQMILGSVPDVALALSVVWWFKGDFKLFFMAYFGLQLIYLSSWVVKSIFSWIHFCLFGRRKISKVLCDHLHENKYPAPNEYEDSVDAYLRAVVNNDDLDTSIRLKAAFNLGTFETWYAQYEVQIAFRMKLAFEDAIEEYRRYLVRGAALN